MAAHTPPAPSSSSQVRGRMVLAAAMFLAAGQAMSLGAVRIDEPPAAPPPATPTTPTTPAPATAPAGEAQPAAPQPAAQPAPQPAEQPTNPPTAQPTGGTQPGSAAPATAQAPAPAPAASALAAAAPAPAQPVVAPVTKTVGFNFKETPYDLVLDFLSREFGLPVIREAEVPKAPVTFISGEMYALPQALDIVNRLLFMHGLQLRREENFLLLTKLDDAKASGQKFIDKVPDGVGGVEVVTVVVPLVNASAGPLAEQLKPLIGKYGAISALGQQNALVIVDTAMQVRKLREMIQGLDSAPPQDSMVKVFPLKYAKAEAVAKSLAGLVAEKRTTVLVNAKGERQTVQDDATPGLNLQPDVRTNSILAVGPQSRLATVEELVKLLDVPESDAGTREMVTFSMGAAAPADVAKKLTDLFGAMPKEKQPTVLAMESAAKVAVVGTGPQLAEAAALMSELDPGSTSSGRDGVGAAARPVAETRGAVVMFENITPAAAQSVLTRLLSPKQTALVRSAPTPDGKGIVLSGPAADVESVRDLLRSMDLPPQVAREVRLVKVNAPDPAGAVKRAGELWKLDSRSKTDPVTADYDAVNTTATLVGSKAGLDAFTGLLRSTEASASVATESRTIDVKGVRASEAGPRALRLLKPLLTPSDGSAYVEPVIEAVDELGKLVVRARPEQFAIVEQVIRSIDAAGPSDRSLRVIRPSSGSAKELLDKAMAAYVLQRGAGGADKGTLDARVDEASNSILVTGDGESLTRFGRVAEELAKLAGPAREVRLIELKHAKAAEAATFLGELVAASAPVNATGMPAPVIEAVPTANALLVAAQPAQLAVIDQLVKNLDSQRTSERPPLRILRLKTTEAASVAAVLNQSFSQRPVEERNRRPVDITPDAATNTLVVSAHPDVFPEIEKLVGEFNETAKLDASGREIRIFPLRVAQATDLAQTIDQMYPEPPIPRDRNGQMRPDLKPAREIIVRADRTTNSLIVDAPLARMASFEQIVEQLDRQQPAADTEIRTYKLVRANPETVAATLRNLAAANGLGLAPTEGGGRAVFTVAPEVTTRTLVVSGPSPAFERVEQVVSELDAAPDRPTTGIKMYALKHARADRLQPLLDRLLAARVREQEQEDGRSVTDIKSLLDVAADAPTNTLIVTAPEGAQQVAEQLIQALDTPAAQAGKTVVRVVPLMFADAQQAAATLNGALPTMDLPTGGRVIAAATAGSNALVLSGAEADLDKVEDVVKQLDVRPVNDNQVSVGTFGLKHVDAKQIAQTVQRLLSEQQENDPRVLSAIMRANRGQLPRPPQVRVEADERTNSLMVSAPASTIELAKAIIERLDVPAEQSERTVATFTPAKVDAKRLVASATPILAQTVAPGRRPVEVTPEPTSGSVVVMGTPEQVAGAVKLLAELDDRAVNAPAAELALVALKHADANAAAPVIEAILKDRTRWPAELRNAESAGVAMAAPTVRGESAGNRLVISAPGPLVAVAREVIAALDVPATVGSVGVKVFPLTKAKADAVAKVLTESMKAGKTASEPTPTAVAETGTNSVVVTGSPERLQKAAEVVASLEAAPQEGGVVVRTVFLQAAKADQVAPLVQALLTRDNVLDKLPSWERGYFLRQQAEQPREVKVVPERRLNAIVLAGPAAVVEIGEQIVRGLDVAPGGDVAQPVVRVIPLNAADATQVAASVQAVFASTDATAAPAPVVRVDASSNSLIVRGDAEQVKAIEDVVKKLESTALAGSKELRLIPLDRSRADAGAMAEAIKKLLEQRGGAKVEIVPVEKLLERGGKDDPASAPKPTPTPAPKQGGWLMPDPASETRSVASAGDEWVVHPVMRMWLAAAFAAVETEPAAQAQPPAAEEESGEITVAVDPVTNSLVIVGPPRLAARVAELAEQLQKQMPAEPRRLRVVPLPESVDARTLSGILQGAVTQIGRSGPDNPAGFTGPVWVQADPAGGALLVAANDTDFAPVGELIAALARPTDATGLTVKVYPLVNTTAPRVQAAMKDLLSPEPRGPQARRIRGLDVTVMGPDGKPTPPITARIEPDMVRVTADPAGASLVVAAPAATLPLIDRFIAMLDQSPTQDRLAIRRLPVANAKAEDAARTMQTLFDATRQGAAASDAPKATFVADGRTGAVLVTGTTAQLTEAERLLTEIDRPMDDDGTQVAMIPLNSVTPSDVRRAVETIIGDRDPARRDSVRMSSADGSNLLIVRAKPEQLAQVKSIAAELDKMEVAGQASHAIKVERADAEAVAKAIVQFYDDRAKTQARPGQRTPSRRVAVVGDRLSSTIMVSASETDFQEIKTLVETFDKPAAARDLQFKVVELKNVRAVEIRTLLENMVDQINYPPGFWSRSEPKDPLVVEVNDRTNSVVLMGQGDTFAAVERVISALDVTHGDKTQPVVKAVRLKHADARVVGNAVQMALSTPDWPRWRGPDPDGVRAEIDPRSRTVILVGRKEKLEQAVAYIGQLDEAAATPDQSIESIGLKFARADQVANSLRQFFADRERSGGAQSPVAIIGSPEGNVIVVSAPAAELATVKQLVGQMDTPDEGDGRKREIFTLRNGDPAEITRTIQEQFPRSATAKDAAVIVTPQTNSRSLIVSAPEQVFEQVKALIGQLDAPPSAEEARITTVTLTTARAEDVAQSLTQALPKQVNVKVTPVRRTNSLLLTGSPEAIQIAMDQISKLDSEPARAQTEFRRISLKNADVTDAGYTLRQILGRRTATPSEPVATVSTSTRDGTLLISATPDQFKEIEQVVAAIDVPSGTRRTTEFVPLKFADARETASALEVFYGRYAPEAATPAARSVTIIPNPAAKSLVVSADAAEWPGIRALLEKLDNEQYDTSRRLEILALKHADAGSVASSLNEAFAAPIRAELERQRATRERRGGGGTGARQGENGGPDLPPVLIEGQETVTVVAERVTNSLIVSAAREKLDRIKAVVAQLDVPEFARLPEARIIPLKAGPATQFAQTLRAMFVDAARPGGSTGSPGGAGGVRSVLILGDDKAGALIVRADESQFAQIKALAETLQSEGDRSRATVRVMRLSNVPAARILPTLRTTFAPVAQQAGETLAIEVDRTANALVVASSAGVFEQIERVAKELDGEAKPSGEKPEIVPGLGQTVTVLDLSNLSPDQMRALLDQVGVTKTQPTDRPGVVSEPVTLVPMTSRRAIAVVANPKDAEAVAALVKALDADPAFAEQDVAFVRLRTARAQAVVAAVEQLLRPSGPAPGAANSGGPTPVAAALAEQIRRLSVHRDGIDQADVGVDLSKPIRLLAEAQTNSVIIASTKDNVKAVREVVAMLDALPVGDNIVVRFFPLNNAAATRVSAVVRDLFTQGERLRTPVGTTIPAMPTTEVGKALAGQIAVSVDERTNTVVAAGREEAVALVEVLIKELDSGKNAGWIEPRVIPLRHADASRLSRTLTTMFQGTQANTPEGEALRRQIGRLRIPGSDQGQRVDADAFAPLSTFVVVPDTQLNALLVVGSPANIAAVTELTKMLDIPAAAAENTVRLFTLKYAAVDRVSTVLREVFRQQAQSGVIRPEDDLILSTDLRSNTLVVSTSERSFGVVEKLIERLDAQPMDPTVGVHVVAVEEGDVTVLAPKIQQLMRERIDSATRAGAVKSPSDSFSVQADAATRSLIVVASDENLAIVKDLVTVLVKGAQAVSGGQVTEVVQVGTGRVDELVPAIREMYVERENTKRGPDSVRVTPNTRLNAIIVRGTAEDVTAIRDLVERLESTPVNAVTEMRRIELKQADAQEVVQLLQSVLAGRPLGGGRVGSRQAQLLRFIRETEASRIEGGAGKAPSEAEISGVIQEQVTITAERRTNSVFVVAPARLMTLVEQMIADLDTTSAGARSIEIFKLKNADARQMADVLRDLFNLRQEGNSLVLVPGRREPGAERPTAESDSGVTGFGDNLFPTSDERQALAITIDPRTNYLIVSATALYLERVRQVVDTLDKVEANEREQLVYDLRNAKANEVATTLRSYFKSEAETVRSTLGAERAGSLMRLLEREVTVEGDQKSNRLLVGVSPRYKEAIDRIVSELDSTPPQVMIQVLLAEVTLDSSETWGMDVSIAPFGDRNYRAESLGGGAGIATALGVPNLTVASDDFALLIRALEAQGRLEVLSRPQILVRNNEKAYIQVGEDVAITDGVETFNNGNSRSNVRRQKVGVILDVTPSISADGFVNMQVKPEISAVSARTTQISEDFAAPIIDLRTVTTNVSVRDGETVVIGGLIQTREEERRSKVPLLGDIPGVGEVFKTRLYNRSKTELLVIITPKIVETGTEAAREQVRKITREELRRLSETNQLEVFTGPIDQVNEPGQNKGPAQPRSPRKKPVGPEQFPPPPPVEAKPASPADAKPEELPEVPK